MWIKTRDIVPQVNVKLVVFKDGKRYEKTLEDVDIYDGKGGISSIAPDYWAYPDAVPEKDPVEGESPFFKKDIIVEQHDIVAPSFDTPAA